MSNLEKKYLGWLNHLYVEIQRDPTQSLIEITKKVKGAGYAYQVVQKGGIIKNHGTKKEPNWKWDTKIPCEAMAKELVRRLKEYNRKNQERKLKREQMQTLVTKKPPILKVTEPDLEAKKNADRNLIEIAEKRKETIQRLEKENADLKSLLATTIEDAENEPELKEYIERRTSCLWGFYESIISRKVYK